MARSVQEIEDQILDEKAANADLSELDSVSNTAIFRLWIFITAQILHYFEVLQDAFKSDVQTIIDANQYGTKLWWYNQMTAYQHGDLLMFIDNVYKYPVIDPTKQILKYRSITDFGGRVQIKVAKQAGDEPVVLSEGELNGVIDYAEQIRPAGIPFTVQSLSADLLKLTLNVYYNASGDINVIKPAVELAITTFLTNIQFDGILYLNKLIDIIQAVPGVVNEQVEIIEAAAQGSGDPYVIFTSKYSSKSGYFKIDPDFPLATQITYIT